MICFFQRAKGGRVLIDVSKNVEARHRQLETHYRRPLVILGVIPGGSEEEREIHAQFSHLKTEEASVLYPGEDLMEFIKESKLKEDQQHTSRSTDERPRIGNRHRPLQVTHPEKKLASAKASPNSKRRIVKAKTGSWLCGATTKEDGHPCRNRVALHTQRCWVHK